MIKNQEESIYNIPIKTIDGSETTLEPYRGKVMLIVNVASRCGFTKQYGELESLYQAFKANNVVVLGFPCNQFLKQEPKDNKAIQSFASQCFNVTFPLFGKIDVFGKKQSSLYRYLAQNIKKKPWLFIPWNFTKVLVDQEGHVLKRFPPTTPMKKIKSEIKNLLA